MTLGERLAMVRKSVYPKMNQEAFAQTLGKTRSAYAMYELDRVIPDDSFIQLLCTKYKINPIWLESEEGDMSVPQPVADLAQEIRDLMKGEPPLASAVMASLAAMPREWWNAWAEKLYEEVERQKKRDNG